MVSLRCRVVLCNMVWCSLVHTVARCGGLVLFVMVRCDLVCILLQFFELCDTVRCGEV